MKTIPCMEGLAANATRVWGILPVMVGEVLWQLGEVTVAECMVKLYSSRGYMYKREQAEDSQSYRIAEDLWDGWLGEGTLFKTHGECYPRFEKRVREASPKTDVDSQAEDLV